MSDLLPKPPGVFRTEVVLHHVADAARTFEQTLVELRTVEVPADRRSGVKARLLQIIEQCERALGHIHQGR